MSVTGDFDPSWLPRLSWTETQMPLEGFLVILAATEPASALDVLIAPLGRLPCVFMTRPLKHVRALLHAIARG